MICFDMSGFVSSVVSHKVHMVHLDFSVYSSHEGAYTEVLPALWLAFHSSEALPLWHCILRLVLSVSGLADT